MSKKKKVGKLLKPRDPCFLQMVKKKQGAHTESKKGKRSREKVNIRKEHYDQESLDGIFRHSVII